MKTACLSAVILFAATACVPNGGVRNSQQSSNAAPDPVAASFPDPAPPAPSPFPDMSPKMVLPATGGIPVVGIPLGGNMFLPATGGPPVVGIPLSP